MPRLSRRAKSWSGVSGGDAMPGTLRRRRRDGQVLANPLPRYDMDALGCGCSSGVEHDLAKVGVEGSNPFARSNCPSGISSLPFDHQRSDRTLKPRASSLGHMTERTLALAKSYN